MEVSGSPGWSRRRRRWAARENSHRQVRYAADLARWRRTDGELAGLVSEASTFTGFPAGREPGQVRLILRPAERMFGHVSRTSLIRVARPPGTPAAGYGQYSALAASRLAATPASSRFRRRHEPREVVEPGSVTVTDQRIVFHGALRDWEWSLDHLVGLEHGRTDPATLVQVDDRAELSGLAYPRAQAPRLRFVLALAVAHHAGEVEPLVTRLRSERGDHTAARPAEPGPALPVAAPGLPVACLDALRAVYLGRPGQPVRWRLAQFVAAVIATAGVVALLVPHPWS
ncbi:MAG TPA: hypothetical protein VFX70_06125 [Mycobacteriales bacterium]|nr:hypothetical protein [Mycobacteriales bacterium]